MEIGFRLVLFLMVINFGRFFATDHGGSARLALPDGSSEKFDHPSKYELERRLGRGAYGDVWLASLANHPHVEDFILKRIMVEKGKSFYLSGLREKYFGEILSKEGQYEGCMKNIARFVDSFELPSKDIWLVFRNEGTSLVKMMYESEQKGEGVQLLTPSSWWFWLKTTKAGNEELRHILWQLFVALKFCHDRNITHRDIKPDNMVISNAYVKTERCIGGIPVGDKPLQTKVRIIDFGSGIDDFTIKHLYGSKGPSSSEQTYGYTAPEALLNANWFRSPTDVTKKYDMWSAGVLMLELILGSPHVFQIDTRTQALLDLELEGWNEDMKELMYKLKSFTDLCIVIPGGPTRENANNRSYLGIKSDPPAPWKCSEEYFAQVVKSRDLLKIGFPNIQALRLVRQLLAWDPEDRLSADEALRHPYFQTPLDA